MEELLAIKLRPEKLNDVIGQSHLIGDNKIISNLIKNKKLFSMIFYGKPGIGKTTISLVIVKELNVRYRQLNAVINNKKDFDMVVEEAKMYGNLVLIMDEIHRLNKDKQDLLLPVLESGLITLIGMTTANPYHSINPAIRSRCQLFELYELKIDDIKLAMDRVVKNKVLPNLVLSLEARDYIARISSNDLRYAYNLLEIAYYSTTDQKIDLDIVKNIANKPNYFHDKNDDGYYDVLSALQKSIRGSDVNASLHYLARLIVAEDLEAIIRRISVIAYEDIGLANPMMGVKVESAINLCKLVGFPEARIILANIVIELALSPKSNSAYLAIDGAINDLKLGSCGNVPNHIKTNSKDYLYPHNYPFHYVKQQYLPTPLIDKKYYHPQDNKYEKSYKEILKQLEKMNQ
ncbi:MAG: replication-associated recombination protein A [bacterium]|nr:replication-associated recombination protein A [bacterium]